MTAPLAAAALVVATAVAAAVARRACAEHPRRSLGVGGTTDPMARLGARHAAAGALVAAPVAAAVLAGPGLAVVVLAVAAAVPAVRPARARRRAAERYEAAVPEALEGLARSLRSGAGPAQALAEVARSGPEPLRPDMERIVAEARRGARLVTALEGWAQRRPTRGVRLAVAALCLGMETGGAQAKAIDGVATSLRQHLTAAAEARALATQAQASAAVIALAPVAFCALAAGTDPRVGQFLFRSPAGAAVLAAGVFLDALGAWWMARLTRIPQ